LESSKCLLSNTPGTSTITFGKTKKNNTFNQLAYIGTFAETAIVNYCLSIADQGKQTSVSPSCLQHTNRRLSFPFSVCSKQTEVPVLP
jgi:hypothetical protein